MVAISHVDAEKLHTILDELIGVFRYDNMPEDAVKFYNEKREDFIKVFTKEVPEKYWFQGTDFKSVNLTFCPVEGFKVMSDLAHDDLKNILEKTNARIRKLEIVS